jgi:hypothetical protein
MNRTKTDVCGARRKNSLKKNTSQKIIIPVLFFFIADCPHNPESQRPPDGTYCYATRSSATTKNYYCIILFFLPLSRTRTCVNVGVFCFLKHRKDTLGLRFMRSLLFPCTLLSLASCRRGMASTRTIQRRESLQSKHQKSTHT